MYLFVLIGSEIVFWDVAVDHKTEEVKEKFQCPSL